MKRIPDDIQRFIIDTFDSIVKLEVLLLLRSSPDVVWSSESVAKSLAVAAEMMQRPLADLQAKGLLVATGNSPPEYRYAPVTSELREKVEAVAEIYVTHRVAVQTIIYAPTERARILAEAFRLR